MVRPTIAMGLVGIVALAAAATFKATLRSAPSPSHAAIAAVYAAPTPLPAPTVTHAWSLFQDFIPQAQAGLTNWTSRCNLTHCLGGGPSLDHTVAPQATPASMNPASAAQSAPQIAIPESATFYDPAAAQEIDTLCAVRPTHPAPPPCASTIAFPVGTNIARTIWGVLPASGKGWLGLYNSTTFPLKPTDSPIADQASNIPPIQIDQATTSCPAGAATRPAVPIGCFYHVTLTAANIGKYVPDPDTLGFTPGQTIVLLALHLIRKETPSSWTFSTFWWQQNIEAAVNPCNTAVTLCSAPDSPWRYYTMDTVETPATPTQNIRPVYNPYIEGSLRNNVQTNCQVCHNFAGVSPAGPAIGQLQSIAYGAAGPISQQQNQQSANAFLSGKGAIGTDHLWTVAKSLPQ